MMRRLLLAALIVLLAATQAGAVFILGSGMSSGGSSCAGTVVDSNTTTNTSIGLRYSTNQTKVGQTFLTSSGYSLCGATFSIIKAGSPTGNIWAELYSTSSGVPSTLLATSDTVDASTIGTDSFADKTFTFSTPYTVSSGTTYAIVLAGDFSISTSNYVGMEMDNSNYPDGKYYQWEGASWSGNSHNDLYFKTLK